MPVLTQVAIFHVINSVIVLAMMRIDIGKENIQSPKKIKVDNGIVIF